MTQLSFQAGSLLIQAPLETELPCERWGVFDARVQQWRTEARFYAEIFGYFYRNHLSLEDRARRYLPLALTLPSSHSPRTYQQEALAAWKGAQRRGVIVLPTGAGKTFVAEMCLADAGRSGLIVVPTIDLMTQWATRLEKTFCCEVGMLGGGSRNVQPLTVATYDSAQLMMEFIGDRFGILVVDECHHLPGSTYQQIARMCLAPYRLGLSATPERQDGGEALLEELLGPICYRKEIQEMEADVLAPYRTERILVQLDPDEAAAYQAARQQYVQFIHANGIAMGARDGWQRFVISCARRPGGKAAMRAYCEQKQIAIGARKKLDWIRRLLSRHPGERTIIFTADNATAYLIGETFFLPVLTHHTKAAERKDFLDAFRKGEYPCLVTSKVLNEGVDVPEASIGIVVSGSGSGREHIQRLGHILRSSPGKRAVLYELVSEGTAETGISDRRRQNDAYDGLTVMEEGGEELC